MSYRAVFLDRDGVINRNVFYDDTGEWESPRTVADFVLTEGVVPALQSLQRAGFLLFVVSNQPSYAKGKTNLADLHAIHEHLERLLFANGISLAQAFYCFHHPRGVVAELTGPCNCRKPSPYFLLEAARRHDVNLSASWMIGDRDTDIECGLAAGVQTIQVDADHPAASHGRATPAYKAAALPEAADIVLRHDSLNIER